MKETSKIERLGNVHKVTKEMILNVAKKQVDNPDCEAMILITVDKRATVTRSWTDGCYKMIFSVLGALDYTMGIFRNDCRHFNGDNIRSRIIHENKD